MSRAASVPGPSPASLDALTASWPMWLARLFEEASWSLLFAGLLITTWQVDPDPRLAAAVVAGWFLLRPAATALVGRVRPMAVDGVLPLALVVVVSAQRFGGLDDAAGLVLSATLLGSFRSLGSVARASLITETATHRARSAAASVDAGIGRLGMAGGGALAMLVLPADFVLWLLLYAVLVAGAFGLVMLARLSGMRPGRATEPTPATADARRSADADGFLPHSLGRRSSYLVAALAAGALAGALLAQLPLLVTAVAADVALLGAALALLAVGGLARAPLGRVRLRVPPLLVTLTLVWATAVAMALIGLSGSVPLLGVLLIALGALLATVDREQLVALRRAGSGERQLRGLLAALAAGQLAGALAVVVLGPEPVGIGGPLVVVALASVALTAGALVIDRRSLFAMRHQVQQFSWNAKPPPRAYEPAAPVTRPARLEGWITRRVELETVDVTLPVSGRHYAIARPSGDGRDNLFEQAKADPERQMPYWAKVWPSGVALADVVVERADEVHGGQALELGAGLGVTACAVLQEGGEVLTADYSLLPLAMCRLNGIANTGRAPGALCFNWRDQAQVSEVLRRHPPIGLVLAADVLYEYRDIGPLIDVIERLLAPGGSLWLAEPVRRTAHRFLDMITTLGWAMESRRIRAEWPDATNGWVNVHIIRREPLPSAAALGLGGLQL